MGDPLEARPVVARIHLALERIRVLAAGVPRLGMPPPATVPRADVLDALAIAEQVSELIVSWGQRVTLLPAYGMSMMAAQIVYDNAKDGAAGLVRVLNQQLHHAGDTIPPSSLPALISCDGRIVVSDPLLLVLSGERVWTDSPLSTISARFGHDVDRFTFWATDVVISLLPVVGPVYDISAGIVGRRLPDGEQLTTTDRVLRVTLSGLGVLLSAVVKGVRVSARTLAVIDAGLALKVLNSSLGRGARFRALFVSVGRLSPKNAARILEIIEIVKTGGTLSKEQHHIIYSFFHAVNQTAIAAHWAQLAKNADHVGEKIGTATVLRFALHDPGEREAIVALGKNMPGAEIVSLPNLGPGDFLEVVAGATRLNPSTGKAVLSAGQGVKRPDLLLEGLLADILVPKGANLKNIFNDIAAKSSQGSTVVISTDLTKLTPQQVIEKLPGLWGNPMGLSLRRVIVLDSKGFFRIVTRPNNFRYTEITQPVQTLAALVKLWAELEKDDAELAAGR